MSFQAAGGVASPGRLFGKSPAAALALLRAAWPMAVGRELALRTEVLALEGRALRVRVPDTRWRKALHRMQREILSRLRAVAGDLAPTQLGFSEGAAPGAHDIEARQDRQTVEPGPPPPEVAAEAEAIPDPEMRALFLKTAALYLERRKHA